MSGCSSQRENDRPVPYAERIGVARAVQGGRGGCGALSRSGVSGNARGTGERLHYSLRRRRATNRPPIPTRTITAPAPPTIKLINFGP